MVRGPSGSDTPVTFISGLCLDDLIERRAIIPLLDDRAEHSETPVSSPAGRGTLDGRPMRGFGVCNGKIHLRCVMGSSATNAPNAKASLALFDDDTRVHRISLSSGYLHRL